jgi:3-oxoacyl-[acyl-carrier-protein] synthase-3
LSTPNFTPKWCFLPQKIGKISQKDKKGTFHLLKPRVSTFFAKKLEQYERIMIYSVITGTGSCVPSKITTNEHFLTNEFYESSGVRMDRENSDVVGKFKEITTIVERRYAEDHQSTSDLATIAAKEAIRTSGVDPETLDYIIVANNLGEIKADTHAIDTIPCIAARVKHKLGIKNPSTVAYDIMFGCPGWLQAVIQADYYIRSGDAKKVLVIGAEILSRGSDPHDRDSMIYADGAGATLLEAKESDVPVGILAHKTRSDTFLYSGMLFMGKSYNPNYPNPSHLFLKMNGRRLYQYALDTVPTAIQSCLEKAGVSLEDVHKVLIHQANGKMDDAILKRLYGLYNLSVEPERVMPMTIATLGNSSVATVPTLLDFLYNHKLEGHEASSGDLLVFASVGAGMNINALVYKV